MSANKTNWDVAEIASQLRSISSQCNSIDTNGFTAYLIQSLVKDALDNAPSFGDVEQRWLTEQEKKRIIKILKS